MQAGKLGSMVEVFEGVADWRNQQQTRHVLSEVLTVAVCAVLCGADDFEAISQWGRAKLDWLRGFLRLDYGIASADTFERVFAVLDPHEFEHCFRRWVAQTIPALAPGQVVAIDGKTSRRTTSKATAEPLHLVSAFAADIGVVLGQRATETKSNEITAIPELLATLDVAGCVVTIDAMGTHSAIAQAIRARGADYVLCVKGNQPKLLDSILLAHLGMGGELAPTSTHETRSRGHGRDEVRHCWAYESEERLYQAERWCDVKSFATVERHRSVGTTTTVETRHYISSLPAEAEVIAHAVRSHWEVENRLHWCLDVQFGDDYARGRSGHIAHNLALVRHIALNLIRLNDSHKTSIKTRRLLAATDDDYRAQLLGIPPRPDHDDEQELD